MYLEMNASHVEELHSLPTAIDFSRYIQRNRPVVFREVGFEMDIPALHKWNEAYLRQKLASTELKIAATPRG